MIKYAFEKLLKAWGMSKVTQVVILGVTGMVIFATVGALVIENKPDTDIVENIEKENN